MKRLCAAAPLSVGAADACCMLIDDGDSPLYHEPHPTSFTTAIASNLAASKHVSLDAAGSVEKLQAASYVCAALSEALNTTATKEFFLSARAKSARAGLYALLEVAHLPIAKLVEEDEEAPALAESALKCLANLLVDSPAFVRKEVFGAAANALQALAQTPSLPPCIQRHACRAMESLVIDSNGACPNDGATCGRIFAPALLGCVVRACAMDGARDDEVFTFRKQATNALGHVLYMSRDASWAACADFEPALRSVQRELLLAMKASAGAATTDAEEQRAGQIALACSKLASSLAESKIGWAAALETKRAMPLLMLVIQLPYGSLDERGGSCKTPASIGLHAINEVSVRAMNAGPAAWLEHMKVFIKAGGIAALTVALTSMHEDTSGWATCFLCNLATAVFSMQHRHNVAPPVRFADDKMLVQALLVIATSPERKMKSQAAALHALGGFCQHDAGSRNNVAKLGTTKHILARMVCLEPDSAFVPSPSGSNLEHEKGTHEVVVNAFRVLHPLAYLASEHKHFADVPKGLEAISSLVRKSWMRPSDLIVGYHLLAELACNQACRKRLQSADLVEAALAHLHARVRWRGNPDADDFIGASPLEYEYYVLMLVCNLCTGEMEDAAISPLANRLVLHLPLIECLIGALSASTRGRTNPSCTAMGMAIGVMGMLCDAAVKKESKSEPAQEDNATRPSELYKVAEVWQDRRAFEKVIRAAADLMEETTVVGAALHCVQLALLSEHEAATAIALDRGGGLDAILQRHARTAALTHEVTMVNTLRGSKQLVAQASDPVAFEATRQSLKDTMTDQMVDMMAMLAPDGDAASKNQFWDLLAQKLPPEMRQPELFERCRERSHEVETVKKGNRHRACTPCPDAGDAELKMTHALNMSLDESSEGGRKWMCFNPRCMSSESDKFMKCACGRARYCSTSCQRADWAVHKLTCTARKSKKAAK